MMRRNALAFLFMLASAQTGAAADQHPVTVSVSLETPLRPGATAWAAISQHIAPGWHTYWRNPGETGEATALTWHLSRGTTAGDIAWPTPRTFADGGVVSYGYSGEATMLVPLTAAANAKAGKAHVDVFLLECEHVCIPAQIGADLDLDKASGSPAMFAAARAALPKPFPGEAWVRREGGDVVVKLSSPLLQAEAAARASFIPATADVVDTEQPGTTRTAGEILTWRAALRRRAKPFQAFEGVLDIPQVGTFDVRAVPMAPAAASAVPAIASTLFGAMLMAFLGGMILNLMPCVLPILSMKALALAQSGSSTALRRDGRYYFAGVVASFAAMAAILLALKAGGAALGWGFQLQSPLAVLALALLTAAIGFNLLGTFELPLILTGTGDGLTRRDGGWGAFFTGALAVVVASPCTAPFMGAALGYALGRPPAEAAAVFLALGTGFALPFTALTAVPGLTRLVPKPGPWMHRFKQALAFPMFATAIWLLWVLGRQTGAGGMALALAIGLGLSFALWLVPQLERRWQPGLFLAAFAAAAVTATQIGSAGPSGVWKPWSAQAVRSARLAGHPVLVDFSAAWCVTCLVNERTTLQDRDVDRRLRRSGIVTLKADWTNRDASIAGELSRFGRSGVPLYLLYPSDAQSGAIVLPQILTPAVLLRAIDRIAPSRTSERSVRPPPA